MYKISTVRRQKTVIPKDVINVETQRQHMSNGQTLTNCGRTCMQISWAPITWNLFSKIKICSRRCFSTLSESKEADYHLSYVLTRPSVCHLMLSLFQDVFKIKYDNYEQEGIVTNCKMVALVPLAGSISWMTFFQAPDWLSKSSIMLTMCYTKNKETIREVWAWPSVISCSA